MLAAREGRVNAWSRSGRWGPTEKLGLHRRCGFGDVLRGPHFGLSLLLLRDLSDEAMILVSKLERAVGDGLLQVAVVGLELRLRSLQVAVGELEVVNESRLLDRRRRLPRDEGKNLQAIRSLAGVRSCSKKAGRGGDSRRRSQSAGSRGKELR